MEDKGSGEMKGYLYTLTPIDFGWEFATPLENWVETQQKHALEWLREERCFVRKDAADILSYTTVKTQSLAEALAFLSKGMSLAKDKGVWQGDCVHGVHVTNILEEDTLHIGFAWKQSDNGTCFLLTTAPKHCIRFDQSYHPVYQFVIENKFYYP